MRLNWHDEVLFPHEASQTNLRYLGEAVRQLEDKNVRGALEALYQVDNNKYAFQFDDQVYRYFTEYVMNQEKERLQWGAGSDRPSSGSVKTDPQPYGKGTDQEYRGGARTGGIEGHGAPGTGLL